MEYGFRPSCNFVLWLANCKEIYFFGEKSVKEKKEL
jgi:hypothetical protein